MAQPARKLDYATEAQQKADDLLKALADGTSRLESVAAEYNAEAEKLNARWKAKIQAVKMLLEEHEAKLLKLMKKKQAEIFDGRDRVDLKYGALLVAARERVKKAKGLLDRLEKMGADDAIIITKSVDWEALEKWTDERLIAAGTERVREDKFSWELFRPKEKGTEQCPAN